MRKGLSVRALPILAFLLSAAAALPALSQDRSGTVEITPFGGGYFGGRLYTGPNSLFSQDVDISKAPTYGVRLAVNANRWLAVETSFSSANANIKVRHGSTLFGSGSKLGEMRFYDYSLNGVFNFGRRRFIPYVTIGAGATTFHPKVSGMDVSDDTRFTANVGAGLKAFFNPHVAVRFDGRARASYVNDSRRCRTNDDRSTCDDGFNNRNDDNRRWYGNGEVTGGLTFAF